MGNNKNDIIGATRWSAMAEVATRLVNPLANIILARVLAPEAFGLVATINIVISFTRLFSETGLQKYVIQHEFKNREDFEVGVSSIFWANFVLSLFLFFIIGGFRNTLANLLGDSSIGLPLVLASVSLLISPFYSIKVALLKREMNFKNVFLARLSSAISIVFVTIPAAILMKSYVAILLGSLTGEIITVVILLKVYPWKPRYTFDKKAFSNMVSFSAWIIVEYLLTWMTTNAGIFIINHNLSTYYSGIYKTSITTVEQIIGLITMATTPVFFSATSRMQNDRDSMIANYLHFITLLSVVIIPIGISIFVFSNTIVGILLGSQWGEAVGFIGLYGICTALFGLLSSQWTSLFEAAGVPKYVVLVQVIYFGVLSALLLYGVKHGFNVVYKCRCIGTLVYVIIELPLIYHVFGVGLKELIKRFLPTFINMLPIVVAFFLAKSLYNSNILLDIFIGVIGMIIYVMLALRNNKTREYMQELLEMVGIKL